MRAFDVDLDALAARAAEKRVDDGLRQLALAVALAADYEDFDLATGDSECVEPGDPHERLRAHLEFVREEGLRKWLLARGCTWSVGLRGLGRVVADEHSEEPKR